MRRKCTRMLTSYGQLYNDEAEVYKNAYTLRTAVQR